MQGKKLAVDGSRKGKLVERFDNCLIRLFIVLIEHLLTEVVVCCALTGLVVSTHQVNLIRVTDLHCEEKRDDLGPFISTINVVAKEKELLARLAKALFSQNLA